ncbi:hypothetical protein [Paraconexibacter sp. AEG42_29]|uniref:hypothetical protein n=1 Tax=Paraconexibacter sp. AEG42_29 TaxID=2997339 RepID=UPI00339D4DAF
MRLTVTRGFGAATTLGVARGARRPASDEAGVGGRSLPPVATTTMMTASAAAAATATSPASGPEAGLRRVPVPRESWRRSGAGVRPGGSRRS